MLRKKEEEKEREEETGGREEGGAGKGLLCERENSSGRYRHREATLYSRLLAHFPSPPLPLHSNSQQIYFQLYGTRDYF